jgi:hypothetical protein
MDDPKETLLEYMKAMHRWELDCAKSHEAFKRGELEFEDTVKIGMEHYQPIYEKFISQPHMKPRDFHFSIPPDYDPSNEGITKIRFVDENVAEISTKQIGGLEGEFLYNLVKQPQGWKLAEKYFVAFDGEVIPANL